MHQQVHYQRMSNRDQTNKEETISQQRVPNVLHQKKTMKTQAIQVNKTNGDEGQINRVALNRLDYSRSVEDECLRKEPFFVNHYYSHPVGQCCCQQHDMTVRKGETMVQSSITPQPSTTCHNLQNECELVKTTAIE